MSKAKINHENSAGFSRTEGPFSDFVSPRGGNVDYLNAEASLDDETERVGYDAVFARRVMEATGEGVLILTPKGICEYANPAVEKLLGWGRESLIGINVHDLIHDTTAEIACLFDRPFQDALSVSGQPDTFLTFKSGKLPVIVTIDPAIKKGVVTSVVCLFSDGTTRKRQERERERLLSAQRSAVARLQEIAAQQKDFVSTVSHELRTPLTSIVGFVEILGEDESLTEDNKEIVEIIDRNARRLLAQVEALLLVSRIESGQITKNMTHVDFSVVLQDALSTMRTQAEGRNLRLSVSIPDDLPMIRGDANQLDRVLLNLLSNAIKFTPEGGDAEVSVKVHGAWLQVQVVDTGMGIPAKEIPRLFEKFFRSSISQRKATPGTGLGLAIVKAIIEEHGGKVAINSEEGRGTAVAFTLPLIPAESQ